jgi:hypothetical protein
MQRSALTLTGPRLSQTLSHARCAGLERNPSLRQHIHHRPVTLTKLLLQPAVTAADSFAANSPGFSSCRRCPERDTTSLEALTGENLRAALASCTAAATASGRGGGGAAADADRTRCCSLVSGRTALYVPVPVPADHVLMAEEAERRPAAEERPGMRAEAEGARAVPEAEGVSWPVESVGLSAKATERRLDALSDGASADDSTSP